MCGWTGGTRAEDSMVHGIVWMEVREIVWMEACEIVWRARHLEICDDVENRVIVF